MMNKNRFRNDTYASTDGSRTIRFFRHFWTKKNKNIGHVEIDRARGVVCERFEAKRDHCGVSTLQIIVDPLTFPLVLDGRRMRKLYKVLKAFYGD